MPFKEIRELRLKNNLTQNQVADALHISQNAYSLIESGKTRLIDIERIDLLAQKFNLNREQFFAKIMGEEGKDELMQELSRQLAIKDRQIEKLLFQIEKLIEALAKKK